MIPLKLETLLKDRVVEQDRIEYKSGWNPSDIIHTICAFANDFANINGALYRHWHFRRIRTPYIASCGY